MTVWRCAQNTPEHHTDHDTEEQAMRHAEELAQVGVLAVVYAVEVAGERDE